MGPKGPKGAQGPPPIPLIIPPYCCGGALKGLLRWSVTASFALTLEEDSQLLVPAANADVAARRNTIQGEIIVALLASMQ